MFVVNDLLDAILIGAFFFGLVFSALSLFLGVGHFHIGDIGHGGQGVGTGHGHGHDADQVAPLSIGTMLAFLTWFGGVAYLLRNGAEVAAAISVLLGLGGGLVGGYVIYRLLKLVRGMEQGVLDPTDDFMPGTIATVSSSIRAGGTGEIIYERHGVRQVAAARAADMTPIARGTEVVVQSVKAGVALVEPWTTFVGDRHQDLVASRDQNGADPSAP